MKILVVDDNQDIANGIARYLTLAMPALEAVEVAYNAEEALQRLEDFQPSVILLDILMPPGMTGYETAKLIRQNRNLPSPLLIAISGFGQQEDKAKAMEAGFDHHITKPVDLQFLIKIIEGGE